jgi:hypothetical protein
MFNNPVCDELSGTCHPRPSRLAALENKCQASPPPSGSNISAHPLYPRCKPEERSRSKILEDKSRLELTQFQLQLLAKKTPNRADHFGLLFLRQRDRHIPGPNENSAQ